jgi:hypothetical protein
MLKKRDSWGILQMIKGQDQILRDERDDTAGFFGRKEQIL